jgi:hypothetical protein
MTAADRDLAIDNRLRRVARTAPRHDDGVCGGEPSPHRRSVARRVADACASGHDILVITCPGCHESLLRVVGRDGRTPTLFTKMGARFTLDSASLLADAPNPARCAVKTVAGDVATA